MTRRALLIGIDNYLDPQLALAAPGNDVIALQRALSNAGFSADAIEVLIGSNRAALSANSQRKHIRDFFRSAAAGDDLWLYISGHGMEQGEHRLIVPNDYYLEDPQPPPTSTWVGDQFLYGAAMESHARSIVILIDACREGVRFVPVPVYDKTTAAEADRGRVSDAPTVVIVYSCARNERSRADGRPGGLSFFTAACCAVLDADNEVATLADVIASVDQELTGRLAILGLPHQSVTLCERPVVGRGGRPERLLIKENRAARTRQRILDSRWCQDLASASIWPKLRQSWPAVTAQMQWIVLCAEDTVRQAAQSLPQQRWRDGRAPELVLSRLQTLLRDRSDLLSVPEIAVALVLPFVYEGVLAAGELLLAKQGDPLLPAEQSSPSRAWLAWQSALGAEEAFGRRTALLRSQNAIDAARDLTAWQLVRFLHASGELWEYSPKEVKNTVGWVSDLLHSWFEPAPFDGVSADPHATRLLSGHRLVRLARLAFATPDDIDIERREGKDDRLQTDLLIGPAHIERRLNELMLAHLLNLAFSLATDARRLSPLFAEHLGRPALITAPFLQKTLHEIAWEMHGETLDAALDCPHEVVDLALSDAIEDLNRHRITLNQTVGFPEALRMSIPRFFGGAGVQARLGPDGKVLYKVPHLRLTLNHARVREILMGEQLYGNSELALRELYQNALDACRYRRARTQYLRAIGRRVDEYVGSIEFRAGVEDGRTFIECRDNGIGMGERHLRNLFARAGSRFTDSHEFHLELARWTEQGVKFWPNSRFGIGVFSYFMMADEVRVETKRLQEDGIDYEPGLILTVVGSGSLFRVQRADGISPGTVVRLYLNNPAQASAMTRSICGWLWLPEIETLLFDPDGTCTRLAAGQPGPEMIRQAGPVAAVPESAGVNCQARLYWTLRSDMRCKHALEARVLVDGILTMAGIHELPSDGLVINLTEDLRADLSVDRRQIKSLCGVGDWLADQIRSGAFRYILHLPDLHLLDLDAAFIRKPLVLSCLDRMLRFADGTMQVDVTVDDEGNNSLRLTGLGLSPLLDTLALYSWTIGKYSFYGHAADSARRAVGDSPHRGLIARLVAARIRAITEAAFCPVPSTWRQLAAFARREKWLDQQSLALKKMFDSDYDSSPRAWWMSAEEIADFIGPIRQWLPDEAAILERRFDSKDDEQRSLAAFLASVTSLAPAHIALGAVQFGKSLQEVLQVVNDKRAEAYVLPNLQNLQGYFRESWQSFLLLSPSYMDDTYWRGGFNSQLRIWEVDVSHFHGDVPQQLNLSYLLFVAHRMVVSLGNVAELAARLAAWGLIVPDVRSIPQDLLEDEAMPGWFRYDSPASFNLGVKLSLLELAGAARQRRKTVMEIAEFLRPLQHFGIHVPRASDLPEKELDDLSWRLAASFLTGATETATEITARYHAVKSLDWDVPLDMLIEAAQRWRDWGVQVTDLESLPPRLVPRKSLRDLLLAKAWCASIAALIESSEIWTQSINDILDTARPWVRLLFDKPLPPTPFDLDARLKALLSTHEDQMWSDSVTAWDLAVTAHNHQDDPANYVGALDQLSQFGIDVDEAKAFAQFCQNQS